MPKVTYTKSKGLIQETGTGFVHTEVPLNQEGKVIAPLLAKYVIHCGVSGDAPTAAKLHNAVIDFRAADGTTRSIVIKTDNSEALVTPTNAKTADCVATATNTEAILNEIGKKFCETVSNNTEYAFEVATTSESGHELIIHALKPHNGKIPTIDLTQGNTVSGVSNASRSNSVLEIKTASSHVGSDNNLPSNFQNPKYVGQTKSATTTVVDVSPLSDLAHTGPNKKTHSNGNHSQDSFKVTGLTLEDGAAKGQRIYLINRSTARKVQIEGSFQTAAGVAATKCELLPGEVQQCVWSSTSKWVEMPSVKGSPSVS